MAVIGPSGCGKTTLIKCLTGIHRPTEGEVYFDDRLINDLPLEERGIGYVFQEIALFPHMNVWENLVYGPRVKGWGREDTIKTTTELLELIRLGVREFTYPRELSGGAKQKVGVARALNSGSNLLFLDEPLGSLDAKVRMELRYEIRNIVRDLGLTAIHITHDQEEAMSIADRVAVMKSGRLVEIDEPRRLYESPNTIFTANFVGEANFLDGSVTKVAENGCFVDSQGLVLESADKLKAEGEKVVIAIRPNFFSIEKGRVDGGGLKGYLENQIFEGSTIRYEVTLEDRRPIVVRLPQLPGSLTFNVGEEVTLSVRPEHILLYSYPEAGLQNELALE
jgi:ABC-type Fe3+/spermidine/putrescine transport system ATPase subunit